MSENKTVSIMLFVLGLFLIAVGIGLSTVTQTVIRWIDFSGYRETIQPYLGIGGVMVIFGIILQVVAFIMTQTKKKTVSVTMEMPKTEQARDVRNGRKLKRMKHRKSLFISIWVIAFGIILWLSGSVLAFYGRIFHAGGFVIRGWYEYTWVYYLGVGIFWSGIAATILGAFGIITTGIKEYLDREKEKPCLTKLKSHNRTKRTDYNHKIPIIR